MPEEKDTFAQFKSMIKSPSLEEEYNKFSYKYEIGQDIYNAIGEMNSNEVTLHEVFQRNVFKGIDYYSIVPIAPVWLRNLGHSQEACGTKEHFEHLLGCNKNELTHKMLYYHDCEMLMSAFQNRTSALEPMLNKVYEYITPDLKYTLKEYDNVIFNAGGMDIDAYTNLNLLIITLASSFDLLTKIAYELQEMPKITFEKYPSMKSENITYGKIKWLDAIHRLDNTIFAERKPRCIMMVEALRNEIIHNGSLDFHYMIYHGAKDDMIEHWIFAPDFNESGTLKNSKNRKKFYSDPSNTFNNLLPKLLLEVIGYLDRTISMLIGIYDIPSDNNKRKVLDYQKEISQWYGLSMDNVGKLFTESSE